VEAEMFDLREEYEMLKAFVTRTKASLETKDSALRELQNQFQIQTIKLQMTTKLLKEMQSNLEPRH
jgi:hypothetical protein